MNVGPNSNLILQRSDLPSLMGACNWTAIYAFERKYSSPSLSYKPWQKYSPLSSAFSLSIIIAVFFDIGKDCKVWKYQLTAPFAKQSSLAG